MRLFLDRASASGGEVTLDDEAAAIVAEICQRLDGVALAIELAAGFVGTYGIVGTARLLANRFKLLRQPGRRTAPARQQTLNAMVDWSYATLGEREQQVSRRLAIFMGPFTAEAAVAIAIEPAQNREDIEGALHDLIAKCLLTTVAIDGVMHFRVLETTRVYGLERLEENRERTAISARHALYFTEFFEHEQKIHGDVVNANVLSRHAPHLGNVRAALEWAFAEQGGGDFATRLAAAVSRVFLAQSLLVEGYHWSHLAIRQLSDDQRGGKRELVLLETMAVSLMFTRGNTPEVQAAIDRALELAIALGDDGAQLHLLAGLHVFALRTGDFYRSMQIGERSCEIAERMGLDSALVGADLRRGAGLHAAGRQVEAQRSFESGFRRAEGLVGKSFIFFAFDHKVSGMSFLCRVLWLRGFPRRAVEVAHRAINEAARRDLPVDICISLLYSAPVFLWERDWPEAERFIERLATYSQRHSLAPYIAVAQALRGQMTVHTGDPALGVELLRDAIERLRRENHVVMVSLFESDVAFGLSRLGRIDEALDKIDSTLVEAEARKVSYEIPELLRLRADFLVQRAPLDPTGEAEAALVRAVGEAMEGGAVVWALRAATQLADLRVAQGRRDEARAALEATLAELGDGEPIPDRLAAEAQVAALARC